MAAIKDGQESAARGECIQKYLLDLIVGNEMTIDTHYAFIHSICLALILCLFLCSVTTIDQYNLLGVLVTLLDKLLECI